MANLLAPLVIIGAGRSGSSLLRAMLEAHPQIAMQGETAFAAPRLWDIVWETSAAAEARSLRLRRFPDKLYLHEAEERQTALGLVREVFDRILQITTSPKPFWGFKEIWMSQDLRLDWARYDEIFPAANYLHLIRDPFTFARSAADWKRTPFTLQELQDQLGYWVGYLQTNRVRQTTGRYALMVYEQLAREPCATLAPVLEQFGIPWDDACLTACSKKHVPSGQHSPYPKGTRDIVRRVPGLAELMQEFGYQVPTLEKTGTLPAPLPVATRLNGRTFRLNAPFLPEGSCGWTVPLAKAPDLVTWHRLADTLENKTQSPLRLFENGKPLGPGHAFHAVVRETGKGAYSHWAAGHMLLFSTSDNSNPNTNGRTYTMTCDAAVQAA